MAERKGNKKKKPIARNLVFDSRERVKWDKEIYDFLTDGKSTSMEK